MVTNKSSVTKRILNVARKHKPTFKLIDLIKAYKMGLYHSDEWEERLDHLVATGRLTCVSGKGWHRVYSLIR